MEATLPRPLFDDEYEDHLGDSPYGPQGWFDRWVSDGLITEVLMPLKSGKEASVYLCRAVPGNTGHELLAAKVFKPRQARGFKDRSAYRHGMVILNGHDRRAFEAKTKYGRQFDEAVWRNHEYVTLQALFEAGADVPKPVASAEDGILMQYVGHEQAPAPQLRDVTLDSSEAREVFDRLMWNVELFLSRNLVHADLSAYNVLFWEGRVTVIDLPQAVDARTNMNSKSLLQRDIENLCRFFGRFGVHADPERLTNELWRRFVFAKL